MKTAQVIADILAEHGVEYAFGVAGGEISELIEAFRKAGVEYVLVKHEAVGAFIADAMGQITGTPGVCISTVGPGATNMVTGVANAYLDRSPVIAISATVRRAHHASFTHQVLDLDTLYKPITKWNAQITPDNVVDAVCHALSVATAERPGAVHLALPSDVASLPAEIGRGRAWAPTEMITAPAYDSAALQPAVGLIEKAQKPVLLVGLTAHRSGACAQITELAEKLGAPVICTPKAKGTVPDDHPLAVAAIDMAGWGISLEMLEQADLFVAVGFDPVELCSEWGFEAPLIHIDTVANSDQVYRANLEVIGDIGLIMDALLPQLPTARRWEREVIEDWKRRVDETVAPEQDGLTPWYALEALRELLPPDGILTVDVGANKQLAGQVWKAPAPYTYFNSNGLSSMGYAFPAAIGAKLVRPEKKVVALTGDGGFNMVLPDLETAVRLQLPVVTVVFNDDSLSLIRIVQERRGFPPSGVDGLFVNFAKVAEGYGATGFEVCERGEFIPAVEAALTCEGPSVVDVRLESRDFDGVEV